MRAEGIAAIPRLRKRTWVLLGFGGVVLTVLFWSALGGPGIVGNVAPDPPPIPNPNGYDDLLEAGREIVQSGTVGSKLDFATADEPTLAAVVQANRDAVARGRAGLAKPFQVPVVYQMDYVTQVLMRDVGSIRAGVGRALNAEGLLAAAQGRVGDAVGSNLDLVHLGGVMCQKVPMIAYLMGIAVESTGMRNLRDLRGKLSAEECGQVIARLQESDRDHERAHEVAMREKQFMAANMRKMGVFATIAMRTSGMYARDTAQVETTLASAEKRQLATRRVLMTELAVQVYRLERGEDPPDLAALVPSILKSVPIDPYSERSLLYRKSGKMGAVYSVGPDGDDDKMAKPLPFKHGDRSDGDFTIDSF